MIKNIWQKIYYLYIHNNLKNNKYTMLEKIEWEKPKYKNNRNEELEYRKNLDVFNWELKPEDQEIIKSHQTKLREEMSKRI